MRTKRIIIIAVIFIVISIFLAYYLFYSERGSYTQYFERKYQTADERDAIYATEALNYTAYFGLPRFNEGWTTNFIDSEVLDFYNKSFLESKEKNEEIDIVFWYLAMAENFEELNLDLKNEFGNLNITMNDEEEKAISHNGYGLLYSDTLVYVKYLEGGNQPPVDLEETIGKMSHEEEFNIQLNFTDVIFVEMYFSYEKMWGEDSGSLIETYQLIILDKDYSVKMIILFPPL
jgi:uncharacterized membrane protein YvbJ